MDARDEQTGLSIRFIRQFDAVKDRQPSFNDLDLCMSLAMTDTREISHAEKIVDAMSFVRKQHEVRRLEAMWRA